MAKSYLEARRAFRWQTDEVQCLWQSVDEREVSEDLYKMAATLLLCFSVKQIKEEWRSIRRAAAKVNRPADVPEVLADDLFHLNSELTASKYND